VSARQVRTVRASRPRSAVALLVASIALLLSATGLSAQGPAVDNAVARARALVEAGDGRAGRLVLDSLVREAGVATPALGELLYWRGLLAESSAEAERDWRRLLLEVPMSPRAEDALLRLAQLEQLRGRPAESRTHLERLARDYPASASQARAHFWLAKAYFEENDRARACGALDIVRQRVPDNAVELRAQAEDLRGRCRGVTAMAPLATSSDPATRAVAAPAAERTAAAAAERSEARRADSMRRESERADSMRRESERADSMRRESERADSMRRESEAARAAAVRDSIARVETARVEAERVAAERAAAERVEAARAEAGRTEPSSAARPANARYSVQLAALATAAQAEQMAQRFRSRGIDVRIDGTSSPFRVRTGYFATRTQANARLAELKARGFDGFIAELTP